LTPVIIGLLLKGEHHGGTNGSGNWFARFHQKSERGFELFRRGYVRALTLLLKRWLIVPAVAALMLVLGGVMLTFVGRDFFPEIDGGQIKLHVRAPAATRIEATERIFQDVEDKIREVIPARERDIIVDDIGLIRDLQAVPQFDLSCGPARRQFLLYRVRGLAAGKRTAHE
jgi:multidrug efflux pump subunit AcrB